MSKKPDAEYDERGQSIITKPYLKKLCEYLELYETPRLNTHLYLHYTGFIDIRNLDEYINLRALWLECNLIREIKNLSSLKKLRCLYLQNNGITKIENLEALKELVTLNLSHNHICIIENLEELPALEDFDISHNKIAFSYSLKGLKGVPSLKALDLNNNLFEDSEFLLDTFFALPNLKCLYMKGNKCLKNIANYRKTFVAKLQNLTFLDEKVVSEVERLASEAWIKDGKVAEMEVRRKYFESKEAENKKSLDEYGKLEIEAVERRKEIKKRIEESRDEERKKIAEERRKLLMNQYDKVEKVLEELDAKERALNEPIDESRLIPCSLKPGAVTYSSGESDSFGQKIEAVVKQSHSLKDLAEMPYEELEQHLISHEFDFARVWDLLSFDYNCTPDSIRIHWFEYTNTLEKYNDIE